MSINVLKIGYFSLKSSCLCLGIETPLETMQVNNEDAHLQTQNLGGNWLYLRPYLKAFSVFNVLKTCRVYL